MKTGFLIIVSLILSILFSINSSAQGSGPNYLKAYNENIFLVLDYSADSSSTSEIYTLSELFQKDINGYRFYVKWDERGKQAVLKNPNGLYSPFVEVVNSIRNILETDTSKILTLFLDFDSGMDGMAVLPDVLKKSGVIPYLYEQQTDYEWPTLKNMVESNQRLVIFTMQEYEKGPSWLHYIWNYAVEPNLSISEGVMDPKEYFKGDAKNDLLIFNEYTTPEINNNKDNNDYFITRHPYLTGLFINTWMKTGKMPNFILMDHYVEQFSLNLLKNLRSLKTITGSVTINAESIDNVFWEGINSLTNGKFCFPILQGKDLILEPCSPGYLFIPKSIKIDESSDNLVRNFRTKSRKINQNLEAYFKLDHDARNLAFSRKNGVIRNVEFINDPVRDLVSSFNVGSRITIQDAVTLKLYNNSFTIAVWIKIPVYFQNKNNYCILGSKTGAYQKGLHLLIRDKHPYMGFYGVDLPGKAFIETGQWYYIVFRYNKTIGEQAIYVNGKLDNRSLERPPYLGTDSLCMGFADFIENAYMLGEMDDLCIWSRPLGEEEILGLSNQLITINSPFIFMLRYPVLLGIFLVIMVLAVFFLVYPRVMFHKKERHNKPIGKKLKVPAIKQEENPAFNSIKLFGDFEVLDKDGNNITSRFTPKLKHLFLIIMLHSQDDKNGISTKGLSEILWKDYSYNNRSNIRRVATLKLRAILNSMDKIEIVNQSGNLSMVFSDQVYCDYLECKKLLKWKHNHDLNFYQEFYRNICAGELFKGESFDWLDNYKGYVSNSIVDILLKYLKMLSPDSDSELALNISELILINDLLNEEAISLKMKTLINQNNHKLAHYTFERFCSLYDETYGEKFAKTFNQMIS